MIFHVIIQSDKDDLFTINEDDNNKVIVIPSFYSDLDQTTVSHNIKSILDQSELVPDENAIDFANICLAAYTSDQLISRADYGFYQWSRYIKLYTPVLNIVNWSNSKRKIENCLSFLSGDKWEINFRPREVIHNGYSRQPNSIKKVSLFSGGLDSFIGAVDLISELDCLALVSHHKGGGGGDKNFQDTLVSKLREKYNPKEINAFNFYVQPKKKNNLHGGEDTQRARSIIFICLGLLVANSIGSNTELIIPENGLISLNVPLTKTRYGSYSTRTTHPNFLHKVREILELVEISNKINNPHRFKTKGEMILESKDLDFVKENANETISCSKPGYYSRWQGRTEKHCGNCVPCIIRRAAMNKADIDLFKGNYVIDIVSNKIGENVKAFQIAISRFSSSDKNIFNVLKSGPIPCSEAELKEYIEVYERGMEEVKSLLQKT